jgi:hypothetical protein
MKVRVHLALVVALVILGGCGGTSSRGSSSSATSSVTASVADTVKPATTESSSAPSAKGHRRAPTTGKARRGAPATAAHEFPSSFVLATNAICSRMNREFAAHEPASQADHEIARLSPIRAALERRTVAELSKLSPPVRLAPEWRRILGYRSTLADELQHLGIEAKLGDNRAIAALVASKKREHGTLHTVALRTGLVGCAVVG